MRSKIGAALAMFVTLSVLLGSATMAIADDADGTSPGTSEPTATEPTVTQPTPTPSPTGTPDLEVPTGAFTVKDAQFRWGINDESNNAAFAPLTYNFFSAGKIPNPGRGGVKLKAADWSRAAGKVRIEKYSESAKKYLPATFAGLSTDSAGDTLTTGGKTFSNHEIVITGGKGTVDPAGKAAAIQWTGSFTVLYYSGYTFFYVTDPKLTVKKGIGTLTATLSGYGSSMEDMEKWEPVAPVKNVVLANLGTVDLDKNLGFTATPKYKGVKVALGKNQVTQVTSGPSWGSFPQSFINYQVSSGSGAYWYSSGGAADAHKVAKPVAISYSAGAPVKTKAPNTGGGSDTPDVTNNAVKPPMTTTALPPPTTNMPATSTAPPPAQVEAATSLTQVQPLSTVIGASASPTDSSNTRPVWILGGALLALAALIGASPLAVGALGRKA